MTDENVGAEPQLPGFGSPLTLGGTCTTLQLYVDDADAAFQRAVDAGAISIMPPQDFFWGDRYSMVKDPFGHFWALVTVKEQLTAKEVGDRMRDFMAQEQKQG